MSNATNSTVSIEDLHNVEQVIIAVVVAAFFLMGMVGNVGILALLWGYKPPHQHKPARALLLWMFGTDFALTVNMVLPAMLTTVGWNGLSAKPDACTVFGFSETAFAALENLIILLMSLERVFKIYFPMRTILNSKRSHIFAGVSLFLSVVLAVVNLKINSFVFNPIALRCLANYNPVDRSVKLFLAAATCLYILIPLIVTIIVYCLIVRIVVAANEFGHVRSSWKAVKSTMIVVGVYLISALPFIVARLWSSVIPQELPLRFRFFCTVVYMMNTAINPYICFGTNQSLVNHSKKVFQKKKMISVVKSELAERSVYLGYATSAVFPESNYTNMRGVVSEAIAAKTQQEKCQLPNTLNEDMCQIQSG